MVYVCQQEVLVNQAGSNVSSPPRPVAPYSEIAASPAEERGFKGPCSELDCFVPALNFGYYAELGESNCLNEFKNRIDGAVERLGFNEYTFIDLEKSVCEDARISTFDPELTRIYQDDKLNEHDITLEYARDRTQPVFHSALQHYVAQSPVRNDTVRVMSIIEQRNKSFGYYDFFNTLTTSVSGTGNVMFSVSQRGLNPTELAQKVASCGPALQLLCEAIDYVLNKKFSDYIEKKQLELPEIVITPKPLRVLETLANYDLTIAQIADKLCIGTVTASKHLETARRALGVKTNHGAIKKAVALGLITYSKSII